MSGSPKTNSMVLAVDPRMHERGARHLAHLVAHEFFHTWAPGIGELPTSCAGLNEASRITTHTGRPHASGT